jgi:hypothetical protein
VKRVLAVAAFGLAGACSLFIPFSDYDRVAPIDAGGGDAGCLADTSLDPANCGACGHDCLGPACTDGVCAPELVLLDGGNDFNAYAIAMGDDGVYAAGPSVQPDGSVHGALFRVAKTADRLDILALETGINEYIALNGERAYWIQSASKYSYGIGTVRRGGDDMRFVATTGGDPISVSADDAGVYVSSKEAGAVQRFAPDLLGTPTTVVPRNAFSVAVDDDALYWTTATTVHRARRDGTNPIELASNQSGPISLVLDATHAYWTSPLGGLVMRVAKAGGEPEILAQNQLRARNLAVDGTHAYWTVDESRDGRRDGRVMRAAKTGGELLLLAGAMNPFGVAVDERHVYWTVDGALYRVGK